MLATTNRRLREEVAAGRFREDLYYRLNVFPLAIAPLRAAPRRRAAAGHAAAEHALRAPATPIPALSAEAAHLLLTYPWPGNVRELDNLLQRALILVNGPVIRPEHIQFELANDRATPARLMQRRPTGTAATPWPRSSLAIHSAGERDLILDALRTGNGNRREAAERLGISARTLRYKLARLREAGIDVPAA